MKTTIITGALTLFVLTLAFITFLMPPEQSSPVALPPPPPPASIQQNPSSENLIVESRDKTCITDAECVTVSTACNFCECGEAVNKQYQQKYTEAFKNLCVNYRGPVCDYECPTPRTRCINAACVHTLPDAVTTQFFYKIHEMSEKKLKPGVYNTEGYVYGISECTPCPPGAVCETCLREHIAVSEDKAPAVLTGSRITEKEMILIVPDPSEKFEKGKKYIFSIQMGNPYEFTGRYIDSYNTNFTLIGYSPAP